MTGVGNTEGAAEHLRNGMAVIPDFFFFSKVLDLSMTLAETKSPLPRHQPLLCMCVLNHVRLCDPTDCPPPGSFVHGIFQARILEWVAISYSRGSS